MGRPRSSLDARRAAQLVLRRFSADPTRVRVADELDSLDVPARDTGLARELALGVVRRQRLLDEIVEGWCPRGLPPDAATCAALRLGAYQLMFLTRVPPHAAVAETVDLVPQSKRGFVNAVLRKISGSLEDRPADPSSLSEVALGSERCVRAARDLPADRAARVALLSGLPEFLVAGWFEQHGPERGQAIAFAANRVPGLHLRPVRMSASALGEMLREQGVETELSGGDRMLRYVGGARPFAVPAFKGGHFVVQDPTAFEAASAMQAAPGETILDLCAAPGTKATWLAEQVGPSGRVLAFDIDTTRRGLIRDNAVRLGLPWLGLVMDLDEVEGVDAALVDVPCSNSGVLARRVEVRHRITPESIDQLAEQQTELLRRALSKVKPGGRVVYSTCSIETRENDEVVDAVAGSAGVEIESRQTTLPDPPRHDGGFFAVLRKR